MADNVELDAGSGGAVVATDEVGGVHYQQSQPVYGEPGGAKTPVDATHGLPVAVIGGVEIAGPLGVTQSGSWVVGVSGSVAVTGPLTDAQLRADPVPVSGTFWQATQPVSGPLTDAQLRAVAVPVSGTFYPATQPVSGPLTDAQLRATDVPVSGPLTDAQVRATPLPVSGTVAVSGTVEIANDSGNAIPIAGEVTISGTVPVSGPLTDAQLRASRVPVDGSGVTQPVSDAGGSLTVDGPLTDAELRAAPVPVSGTVGVSGTIPVSGPLTDAQLRANAVPVSGTFYQATQPVSGPLTDAQLRATAVPVSGPLTDTQLRATRVPVDGSGVTQPVSGTFWQATQPVSGTFFQATQPVSEADGQNAALGALADAIVAAGAAGSVSAKLRRATQGIEDLKTGIVLAAGANTIGGVDVAKWNGVAPTAAASLAATLSVPTAPVVADVPYLWNGTNLSRQHGILSGTALASAARTGDTISSAIAVGNARGILVAVNITANASAVGLRVFLFTDEFISGADLYYNSTPATASSGTGVFGYLYYPGATLANTAAIPNVMYAYGTPLADSVKAYVGHGGSSSSITYSVSYYLLP